MQENKNDAPTSKVFYRPIEASIRWAGLLRYEQVILASISSPRNLPLSLDCPRWGELRLYTERIYDGILNGELPFGQDGITTHDTELIDSLDLTVRHVDLRKLCITQHHLCFPYPFFHLVNFPSLRAQFFAHRQAFEVLFSACAQFLGALMPSSPTALAATNAAPSTNCPAQTRCAAAACSSSDPGNAL